MPSKIPAIPSMSNVTDPQTRKVLENIAHILNVRSGNVPNQDNRWMTKQDMIDYLQSAEGAELIRKVSGNV